MATQRYVCLLRGINVGGRNPVSMAALREAFEDAGYGEVGTYIQSGNVVFATDAPAKSLEQKIEGMLESRFKIPLVVVVRSHRQLRAVVDKAPKGFGHATHHSDAIFLYLNLCSEELYLRDRGLLSKVVWDIWEAEMRSTLASAPYVRAWPSLAAQLGSYPAFVAFVESAQRDRAEG